MGVVVVFDGAFQCPSRSGLLSKSSRVGGVSRNDPARRRRRKGGQGRRGEKIMNCKTTWIFIASLRPAILALEVEGAQVVALRVCKASLHWAELWEESHWPPHPKLMRPVASCWPIQRIDTCLWWWRRRSQEATGGSR